MLHKKILIEDIRKGLAVLQNYISPSGSLNLNDVNVHGEDFVAGLLNVLYGWNLVSTNKKTANYPCIDLIDKDQGLGVQVTSEKGSAKLTKTIECLKAHKLAGKIRYLKVFSLIAKQNRYTVSSKCPGIKFNWLKDMLDFGDAVKAASGIADLHHLQRVHKYVVDAIPSVFPEHQEYAPPLSIPATDPGIAWLVFSSRSTSLIGRDAERSQLMEFLDASPKFSWWLVTGTGGSGKSRLALELCRQVAPEWHAGFLSRAERNFNWSQFRPSRKTFIVIDYVASRAAEVSEAVLTLSRRSFDFAAPVRVLLLEREMGSWWRSFVREESHSESAEIVACRHHEPLTLSGLPLEAILQLVEEVVRARGGNWNAAIKFEFLSRLHHYDPHFRPLYAMIVAEYFESNESDAATPKLLRNVLTRESGRRNRLIQDPDKLRRIENLLLLATLVGGLLPKSGSFDYLAASDVAKLLPDTNLLDEDLYNDIAGATRGSAFLSSLQPDILGERFVLDRLCANGIAALNAQRLLRAGWRIQPEDVGIVAIRSAFDFPGDTGLFKLSDLPLDSCEARKIWAEMVGDMISVTRRADDAFSQHQLRKLINIADNNLQEAELQEATARADYNMGCNMFFGKYGNAAERFDAAIARAGSETPVGLMALLNRGALHGGEVDKAIQSWSTVIESHKASDEMRACALNNRANVHLDRGDHENAIRDRTKVLALKNTSPDRRFVALFRRSESYSAIENYEAALNDLNRTLETKDIPSRDKLQAKLARAVIMNHLKRREDARADLEAVVDSSLSFSGRGQPESHLQKAQQFRRIGDFQKANCYLAEAVRELKAHGEMDIRVLIVGTLLIEDEGTDIEEAQKMWKQLSEAICNSANRLRIAQPHKDWFSELRIGEAEQ